MGISRFFFLFFFLFILMIGNRRLSPQSHYPVAPPVPRRTPVRCAAAAPSSLQAYHPAVAAPRAAAAADGSAGQD